MSNLVSRIFACALRLTLRRREGALADQILSECGDRLGVEALRKKAVFDVSALPFSKSDIKDALANRIRRTLRRIDRDALKLAYVSLAYWQDDVGDSPVYMRNSALRPPGELASLSISELLDPEFGSIMLEQKVVDEVESLYRELESMDG